MKASNGFFVLYVDNSSPHLKRFETKRAQSKFVKTFLLEKQDLPNGNWIDLVFEGKLTFTDGSITEGA